ncbi:hypothetical protein HBI80_190910 [Parastagonospora nodorum]|nr:hypothetical protein HBI80_190910 [Parastagonospora nodorum]KAH5250512.1 hypothetical protein HBI71_162060 [Parastagonospora nodorum]KAH6398478.1 hypothetical protein HBI60_096830 [Parastagonospora nodorum]
MPFWINSRRNAPTGSMHTPTPGPAPKRTQGPSTPNFYDTSSSNQGTNSNCDAAKKSVGKACPTTSRPTSKTSISCFQSEPSDTKSPLMGAADQRVIKMNRHILKRQGDWTRHLRRSQGYKHPYKDKMPGHDDQKLSFRSGQTGVGHVGGEAV